MSQQYVSEFQMVVDQEGTRLVHVRMVDEKLADTYYLREHGAEQDNRPCLCMTCRSYGE